MKSTFLGLAVISVLGAGIFYFLFQEPSQVPFKFSVLFSDVDGLKEGDDVVVRGLRIGRVEALELGASTVRATLAIHTNYRSKMDSKLSATIQVDPKSAKRLLRIEPGNPPGVLLKEGAQIAEQSLTTTRSGRLGKVTIVKPGVIRKPVTTKAHEAPLLKSKSMAGPVEKVETNNLGLKSETVNLDGPRRYTIQVHRVDVRETKADGKAWDVLGGAPDLQIRAWASTQQILLSQKFQDTFTLDFHEDPLQSESFDLRAGEAVGLQVTDLDLQANDKIGVINIPISARLESGVRTFRLSAGQIQEIVVSVTYQRENPPKGK
jgi:preprotein translocase subunit YajC